MKTVVDSTPGTSPASESTALHAMRSGAWGHYRTQSSTGQLILRPAASHLIAGQPQYVELSAAFRRFLDSRPVRDRHWLGLTLDLTGVEVLTSYGVSFVLFVIRHGRSRQCPVRLVVSTTAILRIAEFIRMDRIATLVMDATRTNPDEPSSSASERWLPIT